MACQLLRLSGSLAACRLCALAAAACCHESSQQHQQRTSSPGACTGMTWKCSCGTTCPAAGPLFWRTRTPRQPVAFCTARVSACSTGGEAGEAAAARGEVVVSVLAMPAAAAAPLLPPLLPAPPHLQVCHRVSHGLCRHVLQQRGRRVLCDEQAVAVGDRHLVQQRVVVRPVEDFIRRHAPLVDGREHVALAPPVGRRRHGRRVRVCCCCCRHAQPCALAGRALLLSHVGVTNANGSRCGGSRWCVRWCALAGAAASGRTTPSLSRSCVTSRALRCNCLPVFHGRPLVSVATCTLPLQRRSLRHMRRTCAAQAPVCD